MYICLPLLKTFLAWYMFGEQARLGFEELKLRLQHPIPLFRALRFVSVVYDLDAH